MGVHACGAAPRPPYPPPPLRRRPHPACCWRPPPPNACMHGSARGRHGVGMGPKPSWRWGRWAVHGHMGSMPSGCMHACMPTHICIFLFYCGWQGTPALSSPSPPSFPFPSPSDDAVRAF